MAINYSELRQQYKKCRKNHKTKSIFLWLAMMGFCAVFWSIIIMFVCQDKCHAVERRGHIKTYAAINAIIGEAEDQGFIGMLAVACAIRNRGTLQGVYGANAPRVRQHKYSKATLNNAIHAWTESATHDITHGSTGWGNANDVIKFKRCGWWNNCEICFRYKDHVFYKAMKGTT